jgi:hypothetical protein
MIWREGAEAREDVTSFLRAAPEVADERGWR